MCGGVSGPLTELWKGVGLWLLGIERLSRSITKKKNNGTRATCIHTHCH